MKPITPDTNDGLEDVLQAYSNAIVELHKRFESTDKRRKLDWKTFDPRCKYEARIAVKAINTFMLDTFMELIGRDLLSSDVMTPELRRKGGEYAEALTERMRGANEFKAELRKLATERFKP